MTVPPVDRWFKGNTHTHTTNSDGDAPPEQVAGAVVWLIEGADLVTGQLLVIDSGFSLGAPPPHSR